MDAQRAALRAAPAAGVDDVGEQRHPLHAAQAQPPVPRLLRRARLAARAAVAGRRRSLPRTYVKYILLILRETPHLSLLNVGVLPATSPH